MNHFLSFNQLSPEQIKQFRANVAAAFPAVVQSSPTSIKYWPRLESYYPEYQTFLISEDGNVIGSMNTIAFNFTEEIDQLPEDGWDWMLRKGIEDHEAKIKPNCIGGLQIIVNKPYQNQGYSKRILAQAKEFFRSSDLEHFVIPIRPTKKQNYPKMSMSDYMDLKEGGEVYDPWIRTHLNAGAQIIKICHNSMNVQGDIKFWEGVLDQKISSSGTYSHQGALNSISINVEKDHGEYSEPNIWIAY